MPAGMSQDDIEAATPDKTDEVEERAVKRLYDHLCPNSAADEDASGLSELRFAVGDRVEFSGTYGEVVEMGLRSVRIATLDDNLVSIPNNMFLGAAVATPG